MYAPAWQGLSPAQLLAAPSALALPFPLSAPRATYFYRASNAIYHLARALALDRGGDVLVPDYHHGNEVAALRAAGASIRFYPIRRDLRPDLEALERLAHSGARALFVIHYLGWPQPLGELEALCRRLGLVLIEDCALALLSGTGGRPLGSAGDYAVFCLYKTLPVPNGGVLVQNRGSLPALETLELGRCTTAAVAGRSAELTLEWLRSRSEPVGRALSSAKRAAGRALSALGVAREPIGDTGFHPDQASLGMSPVCSALLRRFNYEAIALRRRGNFELMRRRLSGRATLPFAKLPEGVCPLFFPILVSDKSAAAEALWRRGIGNVQFWNQGAPEAESAMSEDVRFLRQHLLELPIHQGITTSQVEHMADQVLALDLLL